MSKPPLTRASEIHTYNTRFASKLNFHRPKANNNYGTSTFAFVSSQLWETIPTNIKRLLYTSFCNQYKLYLLNMQSSEQPVYLFSLSMICHLSMHLLFIYVYMLWFKFISSLNFFKPVHIFQTSLYFSNWVEIFKPV